VSARSFNLIQNNTIQVKFGKINFSERTAPQNPASRAARPAIVFAKKWIKIRKTRQNKICLISRQIVFYCKNNEK